MYLFVNMEVIFQILQLLTQKQEYSSLQHNFRPAKNISIMSCRCAKGKDESRSMAIPPAPRTSYTESDKVPRCAGKTKSTDAKLIPVQDPSSQRGLKGLTSCFQNIWNCQPLNPQWNWSNLANNLLYQISWKMFFDALRLWIQKESGASGKCSAHCDCYNFEGHFGSKKEGFLIKGN